MNLLLLHGLGGNAHVWDGVTGAFDGRSLAPDLAGHGSAAPLSGYGFDAYADDLAQRYGAELESGPWQILGHSLGGATAIALTAKYPQFDIRGIATVGVKTAWPDSDVQGMHRIADKGVVWFDDAQSAAERFVKLNGLAGIIMATHPAAQAGVREEGGRWRFAADPETYRMTPGALKEHVDRVTCPIVMAAGENDKMAPPESLAFLGRPVVTLFELGHNAHVEDPHATLALLRELG